MIHMKGYTLYRKYVSRDTANEYAFILEERTGRHTKVRKIRGSYYIYIKKR